MQPVDSTINQQPVVENKWVVASKVVAVALTVLAIAALTAVVGWQAAGLYLSGQVVWAILAGTAAVAGVLLCLDTIREVACAMFGWKDERDWVNRMYQYTDSNLNDTVYYVWKKAISTVLFPLGVAAVLWPLCTGVYLFCNKGPVPKILEKIGEIRNGALEKKNEEAAKKTAVSIQ